MKPSHEDFCAAASEAFNGIRAVAREASDDARDAEVAALKARVAELKAANKLLKWTSPEERAVLDAMRELRIVMISVDEGRDAPKRACIVPNEKLVAVADAELARRAAKV
jgi:hypothetical protein